MSQSQSRLNSECLNQLSTAELVEMLLTQQKLIDKLYQQIEKLQQSQNLDSKTSSKPPSTDILKERSVIEFFEQFLLANVVGDHSSSLSLVPILHT